MKTHRKTVTVIFLIVILGFMLRVYQIGRESLWLDKGAAVRTAQLSPEEIINKISGNYHPPLYFILHGWIAITSDSEFSVRLLSALLGTFSIFMIYMVGRLLFDQTTGILAALLLSLSRFNIFYSQETRMYSLLALLTLLSMYYFLRLIQENSLQNKVGYILFSTLLIYTHNVGLFIIIAQNLYCLIFLLPSKNHGAINGKESLFDLQNDPGETVNLIFSYPEVARRLKEVIKDQKRSDREFVRGKSVKGGQVAPIPNSLKKQLGALGYLN